MSNTDRDSLLERWATGMETLEQYYEGLYGPPGTPATLPDVTNRDGMLEAIADGLERAQKNINKHSTTYHNTDTAYVKTVPAHVHDASIEQLGGKTVAFNQLVDTGTATVNTISGHKYYTLIDGTASIITSDGTAITVVDDTADMVCDLTLMLGKDNEFVSTADFQSVFPATHYAYDSGSLLSAGVTSIVSKDGNDATLQTVNVPAEIQALEGYGWSAGSVYNEIDFINKKFIQRVGRVDIGDLSWSRTSYSGVYYLRANIDDLATGTKNTVNAAYANSGVTLTVDLPDKETMVANQQFRVRDDSYTNATVFASDMSGTYLFYELQTPIETDISAYLTNDNLIKVESAGTLEFPNSNGDDYKIPVPSTETFWVES